LKKTKNNKNYKINVSPLYRLRNKRKLSDLLGVEQKTINLILSDTSKYYRLHKAPDKKGKPREYSTPINELKKIHVKLTELLNRIATPDYLYSKKGESYITNAMFHKDETVTSKLDIADFYPSTSYGYVYNFYKNILDCSIDVATILTRLSLYKDSLPTGSCLSNILCFYAHYHMFEEINEESASNGIKFSLFRDDIFFSGKGCFFFIWRVQKIVKKYGLKYKRKKVKKYLPGKAKEITGIIIKNGQTVLRNRSSKAIYEESQVLEELIKNEDYQETDKIKKLLNTIEGRVHEADRAAGGFEGKKEYIKNLKEHFSKHLQ
jgi:hypothetical protein